MRVRSRQWLAAFAVGTALAAPVGAEPPAPADPSAGPAPVVWKARRAEPPPAVNGLRAAGLSTPDSASPGVSAPPTVLFGADTATAAPTNTSVPAAELLPNPSRGTPRLPAYVLPPVDNRPPVEAAGPDPLLDRSFAPQPGWFFNSELMLLSVHLRNQLRQNVTAGNRTDAFNEDFTPGSPLNPAVSPRFELGYRLPNGNGAFALGYRFLSTDGSADTITPVGRAAQFGRLHLNAVDLDYINQEFSLGWFPGDQWLFRWRVGARVAELDFSNRFLYRPNPGAAGGSVLEQREENHLAGAGPHVQLALERRLDGWLPGLAFGGQVDGSDTFGRIRQSYTEVVAGAPGTPAAVGQANPKKFEVGALWVNGRLGFSYEFPSRNYSRLFLGYQYESWFQVGRLDIPGGATTTPRADFKANGFIVRAEFNW